MNSQALAKIRTKKPFIGTWLSLGSPVVAEIAALSGFDWLLFDLEHGAGSEASLLANLQAIRGTPALPIVRVGAPHPDLILHALDWGAAGIMVPHIESADQARACLQAMHYPPRGRRGLSRSARACDYGLRPPDSVPPPLLFAQIESLRGIEQADAIAAVEGVDVLFVGPADLTHDLSAHGNGHAPPFADCLARVVTAARAAGKHPGILVRDSADLPSLVAQGFTHVALDSDVAILRQRYRHLLQHAATSIVRSPLPPTEHARPHATSTTGRQNAPEQPGQFMGSAQNFTGCGNEKPSAGNLSSSTTQMPDPSKIVCVEEFPEKRRGPSRAHSNLPPISD